MQDVKAALSQARSKSDIRAHKRVHESIGPLSCVDVMQQSLQVSTKVALEE